MRLRKMDLLRDELFNSQVWSKGNHNAYLLCGNNAQHIGVANTSLENSKQWRHKKIQESSAINFLINLFFILR